MFDWVVVFGRGELFASQFLMHGMRLHLLKIQTYDLILLQHTSIRVNLLSGDAEFSFVVVARTATTGQWMGSTP